MKVNQALGKADKIAGYVQDGAKTFIEGAKSYDSARQEGKSRGEAALAGGKSMAIEGAKIGAKFAVGKVVDGIAGVDYTYPDKSNSREEYIEFLNYLKPTILAVTSVDEKKTKDYSTPFCELKEFPDKAQP